MDKEQFAKLMSGLKPELKESILDGSFSTEEQNSATYYCDKCKESFTLPNYCIHKYSPEAPAISPADVNEQLEQLPAKIVDMEDISEEISSEQPSSVTLIGLTQESPIILIPKKNIVLDSQILSSVMACARLADLHFNHHFVLASGKGKSLEKGSIVHKFTKAYYKAIIAGKSKSEAIVIGLTAASEYAKSEEVRNTPIEERDWAIKTCEQYAHFYRNDSWVPLEVEKVKGKVLFEDDEIRILYKVKYDLITDTNQGIYPVDHKSYSQRRDTITLNNQFTGQCIIQGTRIMIVDKIGFQTSLKPEEKFTRAVLSYSYDRLREWQSEILPYYCKLMIAYSESGYWPPNYTHCENKYGFCAFRSVCESDRNMREEELRSKFIVGEAWDIEDE